MPSKGGLIYHLTCLLCAPYLGKLQDPKNHEFSLKLQKTIMVSITVSKMGMTELIFVIPGMKVNGKYHCDVLLSQQMLPAIKHVASNTFVFRQDNAPSHGAKDTIKQLQQETPVLIPGHQTAQTGIHWIIRSGVLCSRECMNVMNSVDELKLRLIDVWNSLQPAERY